MNGFLLWFKEQAGTVGAEANNRQYIVKGAMSKWNNAGTEAGDKDPVDHTNADCNYLGIKCKNKKRGNK